MLLSGLHIVSQTAIGAPEGPPDMSPLSRLRVLVAEDDPDSLELLEVILRHAHCEVIPTEGADEALHAVDNHNFDLYLLDNWMAGMSGVELCRKLREVDPATPILIYSGAARDGDKRAAFEAGAQGYLVKPCAPDQLVAEILRLTSCGDRDLSSSES